MKRTTTRKKGEARSENENKDAEAIPQQSDGAKEEKQESADPLPILGVFIFYSTHNYFYLYIFINETLNVFQNEIDAEKKGTGVVEEDGSIKHSPSKTTMAKEELVPSTDNSTNKGDLAKTSQETEETINAVICNANTSASKNVNMNAAGSYLEVVDKSGNDIDANASKADKEKEGQDADETKDTAEAEKKKATRNGTCKIGGGDLCNKNGKLPKVFHLINNIAKKKQTIANNPNQFTYLS
ncbi:hypothetical protein RFI_11569 [Reticulomyxa filosa]|uniref:Uncharacterized protein n=1 Tax=Reticulomyxa filosa TaxID=46433 RepID=X6NI30_RETFI|nr:hypothetical protein RFI_11569 [Reticulomyxa filosa]|eukprot:ETO25568.1 hypothetical protein RFI_11569 [Reticulomyxa filosa]